MGSSHKKEIDDLLRRCRAVGWAIAMSGGGHWRIDTGRGVFTVASSPTGNQAVRNSLADARRYGLERLEANLAEREEKIRQAKIIADRVANAAKLAAAGISDPFTLPDDERDSDAPAKVVVADQLNLGSVNGVAITAVAPAMFQTPIMKSPKAAKHGEELLLADGRVVYRCTVVGGEWQRPGRDMSLPCHDTFSGVRALITHIGSHQYTFAAMQARAARALATRYSKEREEDVSHTPLKKIATAYNGAAESREDATRRVGAARELLLTQVEELAGSVFEIGGRMVDVRNALIKIADSLRDLKPEIVEVEGKPDPAIAAKAAKFDALSESLRNLMQ